MRAILCLMLLTGYATSICAAPVPKPEKKTQAELLVGVWTMTGDSVPVGTTITVEFTDNGRLIVRAIGLPNEKTMTLEGIYKLTGDKLETTIVKLTETSSIHSLTLEELVTIDPDKKKETFVRVKEKK